MGSNTLRSLYLGSKKVGNGEETNFAPNHNTTDAYQEMQNKELQKNKPKHLSFASLQQLSHMDTVVKTAMQPESRPVSRTNQNDDIQQIQKKPTGHRTQVRNID